MRAYNFSPGPATLPYPVLQKIQKELLNYKNIGASILEISHRSKEIIDLLQQVKQKIAELFQLNLYPIPYHVLLTTGGASSEFFRVPMNLLYNGRSADYLDTGFWTQKAIKEAKLFAEIHIAASSAHKNYSYIPKNQKGQNHIDFSNDPTYIFLCSNNTIYGTQYHVFPSHPDKPIPIVADFCSDILARNVNIAPFGIIFAGLQKNLGPAGLNVVLIRDDLLKKCRQNIPTLCSYKKILESNSVPNTIPVFQLYVLNYVLDWMIEKGGVVAFEKQNRKKADLLYHIIDNSSLFSSQVAPQDRSFINVTWQFPSQKLTDKFLHFVASKNLINLKGHAHVGGIRASMYNALPFQAAEILADSMLLFEKKIA